VRNHILDHASAAEVFGPPEHDGGVSFAKKWPQSRVSGWQLSCTKNTPRKVKPFVDFLAKTQLRIWNIALMPKWLMSHGRIHSQYLKRETQLFDY
jgi:hypothetical protein